jgi:hypothetical protein
MCPPSTANRAVYSSRREFPVRGSHRASNNLYSTYGGSSSTGRAPDCGSGRCGFDSRLPPHNYDSMKILARTVLVLTLISLYGCGNQPTTPALTGTWAFTLTPNGSSQAIQATASLTQLNNSLFGPVTLTENGTACGTTAQMTGTVSGITLLLKLTQSGSTVSFNGKASGGYPVTSYASGSYSASSGPCLQSGSGTWSAFLEANGSSSF